MGALLLEALHLHGMHYLFETRTVVEKTDGQKEEANAVYSPQNAVESSQHAIRLRFIFRLFGERIRQNGDKICHVRNYVEDHEKRLEQVWFLVLV